MPEVTLVQTIKQFSKKPIEQLDIIKEIDVLVSLSGNINAQTNMHAFTHPLMTMSRRFGQSARFTYI